MMASLQHSQKDTSAHVEKGTLHQQHKKKSPSARDKQDHPQKDPTGLWTPPPGQSEHEQQRLQLLKLTDQCQSRGH